MQADLDQVARLTLKPMLLGDETHGQAGDRTRLHVFARFAGGGRAGETTLDVQPLGPVVELIPRTHRPLAIMVHQHRDGLPPLKLHRSARDDVIAMVDVAISDREAFDVALVVERLGVENDVQFFHRHTPADGCAGLVIGTSCICL